ncbi:UNVERIFIED_CONTAM: hypothetical protein HDU68_005173 [Siphonaria sp. JEL0065]|nr:hypothetical protein HDU68_005173 [Siphonaria sp. JEL0065]
MSKRKLQTTIGNTSSVDTSGLLHIPVLDLLSTRPHSSPRSMALKLFDYQQRTLRRMVDIEVGSSRGLAVPGVPRVLYTRGGVLADVVGLGKTACCIGVVLLDKSANGPTLVATPTHLAAQWRNEIAKFCPDLKVFVMDSLSVFPMHGRIASAQVVIATVEFLTSDLYKQSLSDHRKNTTLHGVKWRRVIFDECHETILYGSENMNFYRSSYDLKTNQLHPNNPPVWCVSGTPFTHADQSIYGIHQLLNIEIKLNVTNNPFAQMAASRYRNEAFEYLKKHLYLRNTPESIKEFRKQTGSKSTIAEPRYQEHIIFLPYTVFERAFYDERLTRVGEIKNLYAAKLEPLRQLCCHPEASNDWNQRIADLDPRSNRVLGDAKQNHQEQNRSNNGPSSSSSSTAVQPVQPPQTQQPTQKGLSLAQLPARMIKVKKAEIAKLDQSQSRIQNRISSAESSLKYLSALMQNTTQNTRVSKRVTGIGMCSFYDMSGILGEDVEDWAGEGDETGFVRLRVPGDGGGIALLRAEAGMEVLSNMPNLDRVAFVRITKEWILAEKVSLVENRKEKEKVEAEIRYFLSMVQGLKEAEIEAARAKLKGGRLSGGGSNLGNDMVSREYEGSCKEGVEESMKDPEGVDEEQKENMHECSLCNEDVTMLAVLSCGHSSCRPCLVGVLFVRYPGL